MFDQKLRLLQLFAGEGTPGEGGAGAAAETGATGADAGHQRLRAPGAPEAQIPKNPAPQPEPLSEGLSRTQTVSGENLREAPSGRMTWEQILQDPEYNARMQSIIRSRVREEGKNLLNRFIPVYLDVLLSEKYSDFLGEIIIEGHTDSTGSYDNNLKLSQQRALQVALYVLNMPGLTQAQKTLLQQILTATGKSWADLVYDENGREDAEASRRVEFKFSLKDADMIEEMQRILQENDLDS